MNTHYRVALRFFEVISDPTVPFQPHAGRTSEDGCLTEADRVERAARQTGHQTAAVVPATVKPAKAAPVASTSGKKVGTPMSETTKKKLAVAAKARWAVKKTAAAKTA